MTKLMNSDDVSRAQRIILIEKIAPLNQSREHVRMLRYSIYAQPTLLTKVFFLIS